MRVLGVILAAVLLAVPQVVHAQGGSVGATSSTGVLGIAGGNTITGSQIQGSTAGLGNAANTAASGLTGQNVNANLSTNQNTTGINIGGVNYQGGEGGGEGYVGSTFASPSQYIGFGNSVSVNLPQLPGFIGIPSNFSQPYKPDLWVNGPGPIVPSTLTFAQAQECRSAWIKSDWDGGERPQVDSIELIWPSLGQKFPTLSSPTSYVGTSKVWATEKYSFMATICEAAYEAMKRGANKGIVTFVIRPKNKASGFGFGGTSGGTGLPAGVTATHPYALAGSLGLGTGIASAYVQGELMMHVVGLRESGKAEAPKTASNGSRRPVQQLADKPRDDAERAPARPTERPWFGAPDAQPPQADAPQLPASGTTSQAPADPSPGPPLFPMQQVAEKPQDETGVSRAPVADKAWFGSGKVIGR